MSVGRTHKVTFRAGSKTYYNSSIFFPRHVRDDVYRLYGFVRVADDYVDQQPQDEIGFRRFVDRYRRALAGRPAGDVIIDSFVDLQRRMRWDPAWTEAFLHSMELDLTKRVYETLDETLEYIYGSAEVIGLYMASLLDLDPESYHAAQMQGRAMQYINFIRDVDEDRALGRTYLPTGDSGMKVISESVARRNPGRFVSFVRAQLERYRQWQREAETGYRFIRRRYLIPIKTASDMYNWTAQRIDDDPFVVFERQVKPRKPRVIATALWNAITL